MATSVPTYDPKTTATNLAQLYVQDRQQMLTAQSNAATQTASALTKLSGAMSAFRSTLSTLGAQSSIIANKATFSSDVGTATANANAAAGTYSFYVQQLATAGQVSYGGITDTAAATAGNLTVTLADGSNFLVTLSAADKNLDGTLTAKEIASAINIAANNNSRVTASTVTVNGASTLVLTSTQTGTDNGVALDTSGVTDAGLAAQLNAPSQLVAAQDAIVWIGPQGGPPANMVQQASNTFTIVDDVSMTFTKAQAPGAAPVTLTVGNDSAGTAANVQSFVDSWNKLVGTLKELTDHGDPNAGKGPAIFASDAGIAALQNRMRSLLRAPAGGLSLANFGVTAQRDGTLALNKTQLDKQLALNPTGLDAIFGKATGLSPTGVAASLDTLVGSWTNSANGQLAARKDNNSKLQTALTARQAALDTQYNSAYKRYLDQFTRLQSLQSQMGSTTSMFEALFAKSDS